MAAAYALRKHGEVVGGRWILGVRVGDVGSPSAGPPPLPFSSVMGGGAAMLRRDERAIGTPIRLQNTSIIKAPGSGVKPVKRDEGYGWDEDEGKGNWILEKLVSRLQTRSCLSRVTLTSGSLVVETAEGFNTPECGDVTITMHMCTLLSASPQMLCTSAHERSESGAG